ncbi:MAG TPA: lamin tail domain-containing protein, partial [Verrucomicrobiae bacterium]|nr:lamin tail domain-containing protein [Verrucomicrobiae bacterium]
NADAIFINGANVTSLPSLTVTPAVTTTYTLTATNQGGNVTAQATVRVNPAPVITQFNASKTYLAAGETIHLSWSALFGQDFTLLPGPGEVTDWTTNGVGGIDVQPAGPTTYELTVGNAFGSTSAEVALHIVQPASHLVISEFMADDETILADEDGQHSGWIEIHNPTPSPVHLSGHFLTDDAGDPTQWAFPDLELAAGGYLVVFASGKNRTDPGAPLHTNFELKNDGEYLALVGPGPVLLHAFAPAFPSQRADISYGILGGDLSLVRYLGEPTPGSVNNETPAPPARVRFSHPSGTFTGTFDVTLTSDTPGAVIRYTLDGSAPGLDQGAVYSDPFS